MKKITFILGLIASTVYNNADAQFTATSANPTTTNNDVSIQTTSNKGNLTVYRTDELPNMGGLTFTYPKPALSILQYRPQQIGAYNPNYTPTNSIQNIFEIMGATYTSSNNQSYYSVAFNDPIFAIGGDCQMKVGGPSKPYFSNSIYGTNYLGGSTVCRGKMRLSNNSSINATNTAFDNTIFPYTFSVDYGNSRFLGKVQISAPITATNLTAKKPITAAFNNYMLAVEGNIVCQKAIVQTSDWADYVFAPEYKLMPLAEVENYIATNNHLPDMPNTATVVEQGQDLAEIQKLQQAKIEELTLYIIKMQKEIDALKKDK